MLYQGHAQICLFFFCLLWSWARAPVRLVMTVSFLSTGEKLELQPAIRRSTAKSAGCVKFPFWFLAWSREEGLHLTGLACLPWRPAKLRWLQCWVPNLFFSQTGMRPNYCWRPMHCFVFSLPESFLYCSLAVFCVEYWLETETVSLAVTSTQCIFSLYF